MVASLTLPAFAVPLKTEVQAAAPVAVAVLSAAPAPLAPRSFGNIGFTGVVKPKPVPQPVVREPDVQERTTVSTSRSTTRSPVSTHAPEAAPPEAPAPEAPVAPPKVSSGGVLDIAAGLAGIDYIYGGTTTAGFDCSGFTQYVFGKVGISLPRTAEEQRQSLTPVSDPQPGDLVFFGAPAYHNGIYAGNGMLWDSPKTGSEVSLRAIWTTSGVTYARP